MEEDGQVAERADASIPKTGAFGRACSSPARSTKPYEMHGWCGRCGWNVFGSKHPGAPCPACGTVTVAYGCGDLRRTEKGWELR